MPEVQGPRLICRRSSFLHPASRINHFIANHLFNKSIEVVCPVEAGSPLPSSLSCPSHIYYYSIRACLSIFLDRSFIETYLKPISARFYALSQGRRETAVALGPDGLLRMRLDKEAYAHFGITGTRSKYDDGMDLGACILLPPNDKSSDIVELSNGLGWACRILQCRDPSHGKEF